MTARPTSGPPAAAVPRISVLVPTYNYARFLPAALESILAQTCSDFEVIISDDASTDDSAAILRHYAARDGRVRAVVQPRNLGLVANWNWCLRQARGDYVKFVFGDDLLASPHALDRLAALLDAEPAAQLAASARLLLDADSRLTGCWDDLGPGLHAGPELVVRCLRARRNLIGEPTAVMFRRRWDERGFDPAFRQLVDLEMWCDQLATGALVYTAEPLCAFRRHPQQQTEVNRRAHVMPREMLALLEASPRWPEIHAHLRPGSLARRRVLFRQLHEVRKDLRAQPDPALATVAAALLAQLPRRWQTGLWALHRIARPGEHLGRWVRRQWRRVSASPATAPHPARSGVRSRPIPAPASAVEPRTAAHAPVYAEATP